MELHGALPVAGGLLATAQVEVCLGDALPGVHLRGDIGATLVEVHRTPEVWDLLEILGQRIVALEAVLVVLGATRRLSCLQRLLEKDQRVLGNLDVLRLLLNRASFARCRLPMRDVEEVDEGLDASNHEQVDAKLLLVQALHLDESVVRPLLPGSLGRWVLAGSCVSGLATVRSLAALLRKLRGERRHLVIVLVPLLLVGLEHGRCVGLDLCLLGVRTWGRHGCGSIARRLLGKGLQHLRSVLLHLSLSRIGHRPANRRHPGGPRRLLPVGEAL
mmetsp:Transcript_117906/g.263585  ORF Transcript_117906/g.263585 Transcript_117906/m.263585 type:complete len:274 (+) Transcript_117906:757-1578(+)